MNGNEVRAGVDLAVEVIVEYHLGLILPDSHGYTVLIWYGLLWNTELE